MVDGSRATRPGGRTARVRAAVLAAVDELLVEGGYDAVTIDEVANRSGVHRTTVYRRWGTVPALIADLVDAAIGRGWEPPDTGSLEGDLVGLNREVLAELASESSLSRAVIAASFRSAEAAEALTRFWIDRYDRCATVVRRAVARGEISNDVDADRIVMLATAPLYHRLVLLRQPVSPADADEYARAATRACGG